MPDETLTLYPFSFELFYPQPIIPNHRNTLTFELLKPITRTPMKKALINGITGQDEAYLS